MIYYNFYINLILVLNVLFHSFFSAYSEVVPESSLFCKIIGSKPIFEKNTSDASFGQVGHRQNGS